MNSIFNRFTIFAGFVAATVGMLAVFAGGAAADTVSPIGFDSPYVAGQNIDGQQSWSNTGLYDANVVNTGLYGFGRALQISDAKTTGDFAIQTFSPGLSQPAGEATGTPHFEASFMIGTAVPTEQSGLHLSVSPDNGSGARMSYLSFRDQADGVHVFFDDVTDPGPYYTAATFNDTDIATLNRSSAHEIRFSIDFVPGPGNDVVKIFIDGAQKAVGTSWEDYYRYDNEGLGGPNDPPAVSKVLFREAGTAHSTNAGNGFLIDNVTLKSAAPGPRAVKQAVLAEMRAQALKPMDGDTAKKLNEGIKHLTKSVNSTAWLDDSHLATKDADPVFNEEKAAVDHIEDIKPASGITATVESWMQRLATADRQLATTACADGWCSLPSTSSGDLKKYNDKLAKGDAEYNKGTGRYDMAIDQYKSAWKAIKP